LPEVETLCLQLQQKIAGKKILSTKIFDDKLDGIATVRNRIVASVRRSGKTIILVLDDGRRISVHLRMTGRLFWNPSGEKLPHGRWRMVFEEGVVDLVDPRRFATVKIEKDRIDTGEKDLLLDFDENAFMTKQTDRKVSVKTLLMDPKAIAGIGNIYACEILHQAGVSPLRRAAAVTASEWKKIFRLARRVLKKGIESRGTSISDWRDLYGRKGENQKALRVYGKAGCTCEACGGVICRIKQGGRSSYYCPHCQL
ncbi:MAG: DNA-formamidopyrimidine glycosylase family protein, partial [Smithellaceae bacterium]